MSKGVGRFVIGSALTAAGVWTGQGWLASAGLSMVVSSVSAKLAKKKTQIERPTRDVGKNGSDPQASIPVIYGSMRVGVQRVFVLNEGFTRYLYIIGALCHGPIRAIDGVWLDGALVIDADGRSTGQIIVDGNGLGFKGFAHAWYAHGTDGQVTVVEKARGAKTVSTTAIASPTTQTIVTSSAHGYLAGDIVEFTGTSGATANRGYAVVTVGSSTSFTVYVPEGSGSWADAGTVDHFTPDLATVFVNEWTTSHNGKGIAYVVLRLTFDETRFPNGIPKIEVDVRGIATRDTRSDTTVAVTSSAVGAAVTGVASTAIITCGAVHGLAEGDMVRIAGHSKAELNGKQRVDRVDSTTVFRVHALLSGAGTGGTIEKLTHTSNPAVCVRDYLTNYVYGLGAPASEIDDAAFEIEANYHDELIDAPITNDSTFTNRRKVLQAIGDGVNTVFTTSTDHDYIIGNTVRISGFEDADNINGVYVITATGTPSTFTVVLARTGTFVPEDVPVINPDTGTPLGTFEQFGQSIIVEDVKRFTLNGVLDTTQTPLANLDALLSSCRGDLIYQGGVFRLFTKRPTTAVSLVLDKDTIVGDWEFALPGSGDMANVITASFFNRARGSVMDTVEYPPSTQANGFLEDDNYILNRRTIELPFTSDKAGAQRIAMVLRRESRNAIACAVTCKEAALILAVDDVVRVTHDTPGWAEKKFWVGPIEIRPNALARLVLQEYDETAYDLDAQDDDPFAEDTTLEGPSAIDAITVPVVTSSVVYTTSDRGEQANIRLAFEAPAATNYRRMEWQVRSRAPSESTFESGSVTMPGSVMGPDLIPASFATVYQVIPVAVSIAGTRTVGAALDVIEVVERSAPTPSYATPVATSNYIEYGISAYDDETKLIEVWSQTSTASMSGTSIYKASTATRYNDFNKGDGILIIQLSVDATNDWRKTTFAPFDKDGNPGPLTTFVTERATPSPPGAPGSWAVQSNPSPWTGAIVRRVTLNGSAVAGWKVRTYRDAVVYGSDRTLVAGDITATYVDVTDADVLSNTSYLYKDSHLNAGVEGATNTETSLTTGTAGSLTAPSSLVAARNPNLCDDDLSWAAAGNPPDTTYHIERSTTGSGSGFSELTTIVDALNISVTAALVTQWYRVWASADGYTDTGYSNVETTDAGGNCI